MSVEEEDHEGCAGEEGEACNSARASCLCGQCVLRRRRLAPEGWLSKTTACDEHPRRRQGDVEAHGNVVEEMIITAGDVDPASTSKRPEYANKEQYWRLDGF